MNAYWRKALFPHDHLHTVCDETGRMAGCKHNHHEDGGPGVPSISFPLLMISLGTMAGSNFVQRDLLLVRAVLGYRQ